MLHWNWSAGNSIGYLISWDFWWCVRHSDMRCDQYVHNETINCLQTKDRAPHHQLFTTGPSRLRPKRQTIRWLLHHGISVRVLHSLPDLHRKPNGPSNLHRNLTRHLRLQKHLHLHKLPDFGPHLLAQNLQIHSLHFSLFKLQHYPRTYCHNGLLRKRVRSPTRAARQYQIHECA